MDERKIRKKVFFMVLLFSQEKKYFFHDHKIMRKSPTFSPEVLRKIMEKSGIMIFLDIKS